MVSKPKNQKPENQRPENQGPENQRPENQRPENQEPKNTKACRVWATVPYQQNLENVLTKTILILIVSTTCYCMTAILS